MLPVISLRCLMGVGQVVCFASLGVPLAVSVTEAKPKSSESSTSKYLEIDGKTLTATEAKDSKGGAEGLVMLPDGYSTASFYNQDKWIRVLPPKYHSIMAVNDRLFAKRELRFDAPYFEVVLKKKGNRYPPEKEVPLPYTNIVGVGDKVVVGQKYLRHQEVPARMTRTGTTYAHEAILYKSDILSDNGEVMGTINNVRGEIQLLSDNVLVVPVLDDSLNELYAITDLKGNLVAPLAPDLLFGKSRTPKGKERPRIAVPLDEKGKYWMPLRDDGTIPIEPLPVKGYRAEYSFMEHHAQINYWLKEYETEKGSLFGWVSPDLTNETGPRWKSMEYVTRNFPMRGDYSIYENKQGFWLGQLLDGTWMSYDTSPVTDDQGFTMKVFEPLQDGELNSKEEVFEAIAPIFVQRGERAMAKIQQQLREYAAWKEEMKKDRGCDAGQDLYSDACVARTKTIREYKEAMETNFHERAYAAAKSLGGDYFVRFMLSASQRKTYKVEPETLFNLASSATDPALATQVRQQYETLVAERKRAAEAAKQAALAPKPVAATGVYQSSWSASNWATSSNWTPPGPSHQQTLDNYIRDYRTWMKGASSYKPTAPF